MRLVVQGCPERFYQGNNKCYQIIDFDVAFNIDRSSKKLSIFPYSKYGIKGAATCSNVCEMHEGLGCFDVGSNV